MTSTAKIEIYKNRLSPTREELHNDFATSARTSIFRKTAAAPLKLLIKEGYLKTGSCLNFGKGRYDTDSLAIKAVTGCCIDYDYTHSYSPEVLGGSYDMVYSGFVVNTLPIASREVVWKEMANCVREGGVAYISARSDNGIKGKPHEDGYITSVGTYQRRYQGDDLANEALAHFPFVERLKSGSGFHTVRCSHKPFNQSNILQLF